MRQPSAGPAFLIRLSATRNMGGLTGVATHVQSGKRRDFASFAELEQFILGWVQPTEAEPDGLKLNASTETDETQR